MTEHFSFFDAIQDGNGHYDREYNAQQFTDYFKTLVTTGVMKGEYNELEVTTNGANMVSAVKSGVAFIEGRYYHNDALLELMHDTEVLGLNRIDRIVVRLDLSTEARYVKAFIKKGVPSTNPVAPVLTQTQQLYEISLAQILVVGGQTFIASNAVTDERGKAVICPWAGSNILPSYDNNLLSSHINNTNVHVTSLEKSKIQNAFQIDPVRVDNANLNNYTVPGHYSIGDNPMNGPSDGSAAWSPLLVSISGSVIIQRVESWNHRLWTRAYRIQDGWGPWKRILNTDDYDTLFTSVSNGKTLVANAITQKGVTTSPTAEFATMANNIDLISTGKKWASGTTLPSEGTVQTPEKSGNLIDLNIVEVNGLNFQPSVIDLYRYGTTGLNYFCSYSTHTFSATSPPEFRVGFYNRATPSNSYVYRVALENGLEVTNGGFKLGVTSHAYYTWVAYE